MAKRVGSSEHHAYALAHDAFHNPGVHRDFDVIGPLLMQARRELDELTRLAVGRAVHRGEPWTRIGPALGVTRQAAQQKYGHLTA